jgi:hypothetical protein
MMTFVICTTQQILLRQSVKEIKTTGIEQFCVAANLFTCVYEMPVSNLCLVIGCRDRFTVVTILCCVVQLETEL